MTQLNRPRKSGFTLIEVLVVLGIIALLIAILFPVLTRVGRTARKTESMSRMREINLWMKTYSDDNNDFILPSQFDYSDTNIYAYQGKVRSIPADAGGKTLAEGLEFQGTWADILWTENNLAEGLADVQTAELELNHTWKYSSPSKALYDFLDNNVPNPLRSAALNTRRVRQGNGLPRPYGDGADEQYLPGFFAANDYFNARPDAPLAAGTMSVPSIGNWFTNGQIRTPDRVMYLVDSFAGETIAPIAAPYDNPDVGGEGATVIDPDARTDEVDFRYNGTCLMLFLDGHIENVGPWANLNNLQTVLKINVANPLSNTP